MLSGLLVVYGATVLVGAFQNEYDQPLNFHCASPYQAIHRVLSVHDSKHEDRRFDLTCADVTTDHRLQTDCFWSNFVNAYDAPVHFACPTSHYISGMASDHDNHHEDRIWNYYCCATKGYHLVDCSQSGYTNEYDQEQNYVVPAGLVMKGASSVHNNHYEDRRFQFEVCKIKNFGDEVIG